MTEKYWFKSTKVKTKTWLKLFELNFYTNIILYTAVDCEEKSHANF